MRAFMVAALAAVATTASAAQAQTDMSRIPFYPWCAMQGETTSGSQSRDCGFTSYEQCMNYVRGQTGICFENVWGATRPSAVPPEEKRRGKR